jgi:hypothetical protein
MASDMNDVRFLHDKEVLEFTVVVNGQPALAQVSYRCLDDHFALKSRSEEDLFDAYSVNRKAIDKKAVTKALCGAPAPFLVLPGDF